MPCSYYFMPTRALITGKNCPAPDAPQKSVAPPGARPNTTTMSDDELKLALGELTADAAYADYCIATMIAAARGQTINHVEDVLPLVRNVRPALKKFTHDITQVHRHRCGFKIAFLKFKEEVMAAYDGRDRFVHSVEIFHLSQPDATFTSEYWHAKSGQRVPITARDARALSFDLRAPGGTAARISSDIARWQNLHGEWD